VNFLVDAIRETIAVFIDASPYLLFGFLLAGVIKVLIPADWLGAKLGRRDFRSVLFASLIGLPLPLCSCSVIPTAVSLRRSGATKGATVSFLISTPETGVDSISVTYALLDPILTVARPVTAFVTAILAGSAVNLTCGEECEAADTPAPESHEDTCGCPDDHCGDEPHRPTRRLRAMLHYGFRTLLDDLTPLLIIGLVLTGVVGALLPPGALANPSFRGFPAMLLMLLIGIPLYVCATSSTPVAAALIAKGISPGAALVFLLAGPATNIASLTVMLKILGRRVVVVYLLVLAAATLAAGFAVNALYAASGIDATAIVGKAGEIVPRWLALLSALILLALMVRSGVRIHLFSYWRARLRELGRPLHLDLGGRGARAVYAAVLLALYLLTGVSTLRPGETGWVVSFGRITRTVTEPGLVIHAPYPFERLVKEKTAQVRTIDRGFRRGVPAPRPNTPAATELTREAEVATGEETLLAIRYCVQYRVADPFVFRFRVDDPAQLVAAFAEHSVRDVIAGEPTDSVLIGDREKMEARVAEHLAGELAGVGAGVEVVRIDLVDVHAPAEVHSAYRDVSSALEDHERYIRQAESYAVATVAAARAAAYRSGSQAEADRVTRVARAHGESAGFTALEAASRRARAITRLRLYLDTASKVLPQARLILPLADMPLDLWVKLTANASEWPEPALGAPTAPAAAPAEPAAPGSEGWREKLEQLRQSQQEK
jgi:HflK protein